MSVFLVGVLALTAAFAQPDGREASSPKPSFVGTHAWKYHAASLTTDAKSATGRAHPRLTPLEVAPGYEVVQIPYGGRRFAWIDNDVVFFAGAPHPLTKDPPIHPPYALFQWNVVSNTVKKLSDLGDAPDVCYDRGHLYVGFNRGDERVIRQGTIKEQQETVVIRKDPSPFPGDLNRYDCKFRKTPPSTRAGRRVITVLREDHGFIEVEYGASVSPAGRYFLVPPRGDPIPIDLPCGAGGPRYVDFVPGYVYQHGRSFMDDKVGPLVCIVRVNGVASTYQLPAGDWLRATVYGVPVRNGMLMISLATRAKADGVYLIDERGTKKIISGYVGGYPTQFTVSPDGCKVAMAISPNDHDWGRNAVLSVCTRGG